MDVTQAAQWALLIYGTLMIVGGILGYVVPEKPSKISLVAGGASGLLAFASFVIIRYDHALPGLAIGLVVTAGVGVMMFLRFRETRKLMPGGIVAIVSAAAALTVVGALATL
jgi:uncharacterized membrane protein (UPF0136 family)